MPSRKEHEMVNEAPREAPRDESASTGQVGDDAATAQRPAGPPEGFEPPEQGAPAPDASPWPTLGQQPQAPAQEQIASAQGPGTWPTLGQRQAGGEAGGEATGGYGTPEYLYEGYGAGPGGVPPQRPRRLYRSETDRVVAGVCGGLSDYLGVDANLLRVAFALLAIFAGGSGLLIYVVLWALVPRESRLGLSPSETAMDAVNEVRERFQGVRRA
jgi:phage shock protein PspC (stress-responsive transcriptional regulator)